MTFELELVVKNFPISMLSVDSQYTVVQNASQTSNARLFLFQGLGI